MKKYPSIQSFGHVIRGSQAWAKKIGVPFESLPSISYTGTVKLHGSNMGVCVTPANDVIPQQRNTLIDAENSGYGFHSFFMNMKNGTAPWIELANTICNMNNLTRDADVTIFGEWVGRGVQHGRSALTELDKHFVIFGAWYGEDTALNTKQLSLQCPEFERVYNPQGIYSICQIPAQHITIDFSNVQAAVDKLETLTAEVDARCPWAFRMFGVEGNGEGWVWQPDGRLDEDNLYFKTKGSTHKVRNNPRGEAAPIDIEKVNSIKECVDVVLTEARMEQMVHDNNLTFAPESIGPFLAALAKDIIKEEQHVLDANGLTWKEVGKLVQSIAKTWFMERITLATMNPNS